MATFHAPQDFLAALWMAGTMLRAHARADFPNKTAALLTAFTPGTFEPISWSADEIVRQTKAKSKIHGQLVKRAYISLQ